MRAFWTVGRELRRRKPEAVLVRNPRKSLRDFVGLRVHKAPRVRTLLNRSGFAPPRQQAKAELRRVAARTTAALHEALGPAPNAVAPQGATGFFHCCGHNRPN